MTADVTNSFACKLNSVLLQFYILLYCLAKSSPGELTHCPKIMYQFVYLIQSLVASIICLSGPEMQPEKQNDCENSTNTCSLLDNNLGQTKKTEADGSTPLKQLCSCYLSLIEIVSVSK